MQPLQVTDMHSDLWRALRRVADGDPPGSPEACDALMGRGLIEWAPGQSRPRVTAVGLQALATSRS
jgi:hypothetical protein